MAVATAPGRTGIVSILLVPIVHPIAVTLCDNSLPNVIISSESMSQHQRWLDAHLSNFQAYG